MNVADLASLSTVFIASGNLAGIALSGKSDKTEKSDNAEADSKTEQPSNSQASVTKLSEKAQAALAQLKTRDRQVRAHEQAHLAASGGLATSGPSYVYQKGPDGVNYAVGGEVSIDVSPGRDPPDTIDRAQRIQAAALAPADPSSVDFAVAAQAQQMEQQARGELLLQQAQQIRQTDEQKKRLNATYGVDNAAPLPSDLNGINHFA